MNLHNQIMKNKKHRFTVKNNGEIHEKRIKRRLKYNYKG